VLAAAPPQSAAEEAANPIEPRFLVDAFASVVLGGVASCVSDIQGCVSSVGKAIDTVGNVLSDIVNGDDEVN
jgi:hypothetical protein